MPITNNIQRLVFFFVIIFTSLVIFDPTVEANGTNESTPQCWSDSMKGKSGCDWAFYKMNIDISNLKDNYVIIKRSKTDYHGDESITIEEGDTIEWPSIDALRRYRIVKKDYFYSSGGIDGLFKKYVPSKEDLDGGAANSYISPKDESELNKNSVGILIPMNDDIKDFNSYGQAEIVIGGQFRSLATVLLFIKSPYPYVVKERHDYYKPVGQFCENTNCSIVISRYKEKLIMIDSSEKTNTFDAPSFRGVQSLDTSSTTIDTTTKSPKTFWQNIYYIITRMFGRTYK